MITIISNTNWIYISESDEDCYFKDGKLRISSITKYDTCDNNSRLLIQYGSSDISFLHGDITSINGNIDITSNQKLYDAFDNIIDPQP